MLKIQKLSIAALMVSAVKFLDKFLQKITHPMRKRASCMRADTLMGSQMKRSC